MLLALFELSNGEEFSVHCESLYYDESGEVWVCNQVSWDSDGYGPALTCSLPCDSGNFLRSVSLIEKEF